MSKDRGIVYNNDVTQEQLKEILEYDQNSGWFIWKTTRCNRALRGSRASCKAPSGYRQIKIGDAFRREHRLAWLYVTGSFPEHEIDHINGVRDDNRFCNLRKAVRFENNQNSKLHPKNTSGFRGVSWSKTFDCWIARIDVRRKTYSLGRFDNPETASLAYLEAKRRFHTFQPVPRDH